MQVRNADYVAHRVLFKRRLAAGSTQRRNSQVGDRHCQQNCKPAIATGIWLLPQHATLQYALNGEAACAAARLLNAQPACRCSAALSRRP